MPLPRVETRGFGGEHGIRTRLGRVSWLPLIPLPAVRNGQTVFLGAIRLNLLEAVEN
jgi:hypothetical protein